MRQQLFSGEVSDCAISACLSPSLFPFLVCLHYVSLLVRYLDDAFVIPHFIRPKGDQSDLYSSIDISSTQIKILFSS